MIRMVLFLALSVTGCAGKAPASENGGEKLEVGEAGTVTEGESLYVREYIPLIVADPDLEYQDRRFFADAYGSRLYILGEYTFETSDGDARAQYFMNVYDAGTRRTEQEPFGLEIPDGDGCRIVNMDVTKEDEISFRIRDYSDRQRGDFLMKTDGKGNALSVDAPFPDASEYPWNAESGTDRRVFDNADGSVYISEWSLDEDETKLYSFDTASGSRRVLATLKGESLAALCQDEQGIVYYVSSGRLIRWNREKNSREDILTLQEINFPTSFFAALLPAPSGELLLCSLSGLHDGRLGIYVLSEEEAPSVDEIRMAYLWSDYSEYATGLATTYSYEHSNCPIRREQAKGDEDAFRDRIFMELAAGKGPELLWVSKEDAIVLEKAGLLMDISQLISEDVMEQLFPCVIENGIINGRMVMLTTTFSTKTMIVSDDIWPGESWKLSDFLEIAEERDDWTRLVCNSFDLYGLGYLHILTGDLASSPFLDMEQGIARFDSEEFRRLLEISKRFGTRAKEPERLGSDQRWEMMKEGECAAEIVDMFGDMVVFSELMAKYEGICHMAGYPSEDGSQHYMYNYDGYLVVNAKAEHVEEIREYIGLLLDYGNQYTVTCNSVRRDVTVDRVTVWNDGEKDYFGIMKNYNADIPCYAPLEVKPDGTTYLEEYMAFLENCVPEPDWPSQINTIIFEELSPYYYGDREVEEAVKVIQNRVQLYLDERK